MKKFILLLFTIVTCAHVNAQDANNVEKSFGVSFTASTISEGYDWGIGILSSQDFDSSGLGFGYIVQISYLQPSDAISDIIEYGYSSDVLLKYDIELSKGFEIAPTAGVGYLGVQSDSGNSTDFYFAAGGTGSYFISKSTILGFELTKPFLEGANISLAFSVRFQL